MSYWRFAAMILTSAVVMFGLMYLNTYLIGHAFFSETRAYMAILMGAVMAFIMLGFMFSMYSNKAANAAIFAGAIVVFAGALWLVRSQATVGDLSYMRAMIPHHSIAIMTSNRANLSDARVQGLARGIAEAQNKEIAEMRHLIADIAANGDRTGRAGSGPASIVPLDEALSTPVIARLDAEPMTDEEIARAFPGGEACAFAYTTKSRPVLATNGNAGLIKISADLVEVEGDDGRFGVDGLQIDLRGRDGSDLATSGTGLQEATMTLVVDQELEAGYAGWWRCSQ